MSELDAEPLVTECPHCQTRFRVTESQLEIAGGKVRCGACLSVFQGVDHLVWDEDSGTTDDRSLDELLDELDDFEADHEEDLVTPQASPADEFELEFEDDSAESPSLPLDDDGEIDAGPIDADPIDAGQVDAEPTVEIDEIEIDDVRTEDVRTDDGLIDDDVDFGAETLAFDDEGDDLGDAAKDIIAAVGATFDEELTVIQVDDEETREDPSSRVAVDAEDSVEVPAEDSEEEEPADHLDEISSDDVFDIELDYSDGQPTSERDTTLDGEPTADDEVTRVLPRPAPAHVDVEPEDVDMEVRSVEAAFTDPVPDDAPPESRAVHHALREESGSEEMALAALQPKDVRPAESHADQSPHVALDEAPNDDAEATATLKRHRLHRVEPVDVVREPPDVEIDDEEDAPRSRSWLPVVIVLGCLAVALQVLWLQQDRWSRDPTYRPVYAALCQVFRCELPPLKNVALIYSKNLVVRSHPTVADALTVDALIVNEAEYAQAYPVVELLFKSIDGELVAGRRFQPNEYLAGELAGSTEMESLLPIHISLEIEDPGPEAVSYTMKFR